MTVFVPTIEWLINLQPGIWAFERIGDHEYKYYVATPDYIITNPGVFGIQLTDESVSDPQPPKYLGKLPAASPSPQPIEGGRLKLVTLPADTKLYKGMGGKSNIDRTTLDGNRVSFYALDPAYAARFAVMAGGIGGIAVYKTTRQLTGYVHCYRNNDIIYELLSGYKDKSAESILRGVFNRNCVDTPDILDVIIRCSEFYKIEYPWYVNKANLRNALGQPTQCINKVHTGSTDYKTNAFLLSLGEQTSNKWDFTYTAPEPIIYDYTLNWLSFGADVVCWRDSDAITRCIDDPLDMENNVRSERYSVNLRMHQLNATSLETILDWYWANKYNTPVKKQTAYRVMSYNIHKWTPINTDVPKMTLMDSVADLLQQYDVDIAFLQEHDPNVPFNVVGYRSLMSDKPGFLTVLTLVKNSIDLVEYKYTPFGAFRGYRYNREQKGVAVVDVKLEGKALRLAGTHLSIYVGPDTDIRGAELAQIAQLTPPPDILCGDFNERTIEFKNYTVSKLNMTTPFGTVDHFASNITGNTFTASSNYSDHLPIFMDFNI